MSYVTPEFLILCTFAVLACRLARSSAARARVLLGASLVFYAWSGVLDTLVFLSVVAISWLAAWAAGRWPRWRRPLLAAGIALMAAHLAVWKYLPWLVGEVERAVPGLLGGATLALPLPVGISFFTLQGIAYLVDYGRGRAAFMRFREYLLFKSFFAQLVAGPIVRAHQLQPQLARIERARVADMAAGLALFCGGFLKKLVIADRCAQFVDPVFADPGAFGRGALALALLGYAVQIWGDFSGYTDMGRGAARMVGLRLPENFHSPYLARSPSEFWRRWHVTLSEWIRDYVYVPLGGNRGSRARAGAVALVTMAGSGLWHGASWTFVLWGLYHGALLMVERALGCSERLAAAWRGVRPWGRAALSATATQAAVLFGWLLFRAQDLAIVGAYLRRAVEGGGGPGPDGAASVCAALALGLAMQVVGYRDLPAGRRPVLERTQTMGRRLLDGAGAATAWPRTAGVACGVALALVFVGTLVLRPSDRVRAFIYFQF